MSNLAKNERAHFDYELAEKFEAGLSLRGPEVKSLKTGHGRLAGARVLIRGGEAFLVGAAIPPYQAANLPPNYDSERSIKLLLDQKEIAHLDSAASAQGLTIIPVAIYNKKGRLKLELWLGRAKKKFDKRQKIKARETKRQIERTLKNKF
jgi:SsrA-binding protein